jgi:hypothetical protein
VVRARRGRPLPRSSCGLTMSGFRAAASRPPAWRGTWSSACANAGGHGCRRRSLLRRPLARTARPWDDVCDSLLVPVRLLAVDEVLDLALVDGDGVAGMLVLPGPGKCHPERLRTAVLDRELPRLFGVVVAEEHLDQRPVRRRWRLRRAPPRRTTAGRRPGPVAAGLGDLEEELVLQRRVPLDLGHHQLDAPLGSLGGEVQAQLRCGLLGQLRHSAALPRFPEGSRSAA